MLTAGLFSGCSTDTTYLPVLLDDPMAGYQSDGIHLIESYERGRGTSLVTGKVEYAKVSRRYELEDPSQASRVLDAAVSYAASHGWTFGEDYLYESSTGALVASGTRDMDWGLAQLNIAVGPSVEEPGTLGRLLIVIGE